MGMDEPPSSLVEGEVHVHLSHFSELSKSTSVHGYVSVKAYLLDYAMAKRHSTQEKQE